MLVATDITRTASFSRCKQYRYKLERRWNQHAPTRRVVFIGLNPSTADHRVDDPTIRRCMDFTQRWGYNSVSVVNLFAYRTPYPKLLRQALDPIGPYNTKHLKNVIDAADLVIACWGKHGNWQDRDKRLAKRYSNALHCLAVNRDGSPAHPLYQRADTQPMRWNGVS